MKDWFGLEYLERAFESEFEASEVSEGTPAFCAEGPVEEFEAVSLWDRFYSRNGSAASTIIEGVSAAGFYDVAALEQRDDLGESWIWFGHAGNVHGRLCRCESAGVGESICHNNVGLSGIAVSILGIG